MTRIRGVHVGLGVVGVFGLLFLAACGGGGSGSSSGATTETMPPTTSTSTSTNGGGTTTSGGGMAAKGATLADNLGCGSCHSIDGSSGVGPTWKGLYGSQVKLANGKTVTADEQYLTESITSPDAEIVSGYKSGLMTSAVPPGSVSKADAAALVAYIKSLNG